MTAQYCTWSMYPASTPLSQFDSRKLSHKNTLTGESRGATAAGAPISRASSSESSSNTLRQTVTSPESTSTAPYSINSSEPLPAGIAALGILEQQGQGPNEPGNLLRSNSTSSKPTSKKHKRTHRFRHTRTSSSGSAGSNSVNPRVAAAAAAAAGASAASKPGRSSHESSLRIPGLSLSLLHRSDHHSTSSSTGSGRGASETRDTRSSAAPDTRTSSERHLHSTATSRVPASPASPKSPVKPAHPLHPLHSSHRLHQQNAEGSNLTSHRSSHQSRRSHLALSSGSGGNDTNTTTTSSSTGAGKRPDFSANDVASGSRRRSLSSRPPRHVEATAAGAGAAAGEARHPTVPAPSPETSGAAGSPIINNTPTSITGWGSSHNQNQQHFQQHPQHHSNQHHNHHHHHHNNNNKLVKLAATTSSSSHFPQRFGLSASELKYVAMLPDYEASSGKASKINPTSNKGGSSTASLSSVSGAASRTLTNNTMTTASSDTFASADTLSTFANRPFVPRNGRTYLNDPTLPYPLPVDLTELHRQSLRTLLLIQVFGAPVCSPSFATRPPARVLEVGCGSGFWSMMCHRYFRERGHSGISFTGLDVAPLAPGSGGCEPAKPDRDMKWRFVQHDIRQTPFPFAEGGEFDLIMVKDMSLATTNAHQQTLMDEYLRLLRPGGTLEVWESDHTIRMLRPHVPGSTPSSTTDEDEEHEAARSLGAYVMSANTPLSPPLNNFLVEYNSWLSRALESRDLCPVPCTRIGPSLLQESDYLHDVRSRRLAVPLSEVRWEKEGVSGVVTKDGKSYIDTRGKASRSAGDGEKRALTAGQAALRRTALTTVVQQVQSLEPLLREVSGKRQDEWDNWIGKMMNDLMKENGTSWGECLEVGAWWAKKRKRTR